MANYSSWEKSNRFSNTKKSAHSSYYTEEEEEGDDDESCGFICFALGVILLFVGVAVLATVLVYNQSTENKTRVVSLTSTRDIRPVSEHLLEAIRDPESMKLIDFTSSNKADSLLLLIIIHSLPESLERRMLIRETWKRDVSSKLRTVVCFAIPAKWASPDTLSNLESEGRKHKDMVVFLDSSDMPESESLLFELVWASKMYAFSYFMKVRDTVYVRVSKLVEDIVLNLERAKSNTYLGYFEGRGDPKGNENHPEPDWFLCDNFIRFAHSGGYILSTILVKRLVSQAEYLHPYNNEDVAVGTWLSPFKDIDWQHNIHFDTDIGRARGCKNDYIVFQPAQDEMIATDNRLSTGGNCCAKEFEVIKSYTYNFETLPSKCCTEL